MSLINMSNLGVSAGLLILMHCGGDQNCVVGKVRLRGVCESPMILTKQRKSVRKRLDLRCCDRMMSRAALSMGWGVSARFGDSWSDRHDERPLKRDGHHQQTHPPDPRAQRTTGMARILLPCALAAVLVVRLLDECVTL